MKKIIMYSVCSFAVVMMVGVVLGYNSFNKSQKAQNIENTVDYDYVYDILKTPIIQVTNTSEDVIVRPYTNTNVKIVKNYYDYQSDEEEQRKSIIYYDGTYMQSTGVSYSSGDRFDVVAVLKGEVTEVTTDELIGNSITIKHDDNTYSIYQSISDIQVAKGDIVKQGDKLAISNISDIEKDLNNHLYFELVINGVSVNPEEYYDAAL